MKKLFITLVVLLSVSGLFAEEESLYKKDTKSSTLELKKTSEGFILTDYEIDIDNETYHLNIIFCENEEKIKKFLVYLIDHNVNYLFNPTIMFYEMKYEELTEISNSLEIAHNKIIDCRNYILK